MIYCLVVVCSLCVVSLAGVIIIMNYYYYELITKQCKHTYSFLFRVPAYKVITSERAVYTVSAA